jgi:hypothetical protein
MLEDWKNGVMEYWSTGVMKKKCLGELGSKGRKSENLPAAAIYQN